MITEEEDAFRSSPFVGLGRLVILFVGRARPLVKSTLDVTHSTLNWDIFGIALGSCQFTLHKWTTVDNELGYNKGKENQCLSVRQS